MGFHYLKKARENERNYIEIIDEIKRLCDEKSTNRYIKYKESDENSFGIFDYYVFNEETHKLGLKLTRLRKDVFPQLTDDRVQTLEDLEDLEDKNIVETTHVIVDFSNTEFLQLGIEFNTEGPRIKELMFFVRKIGNDLNLIRSLKTIVIANDRLEEVANKIGNCKFLEVKVLQENIANVKAHDKELGDILEKISEFTKTQYATVRLRLDYETGNAANLSKVQKFVRLFAKNRGAMDYYDTFKVEADDINKPDSKNFEAYDLLMDKVKSKVKADRKHTSKVIVSNNMYKLMLTEFKDKIN